LFFFRPALHRNVRATLKTRQSSPAMSEKSRKQEPSAHFVIRLPIFGTNRTSVSRAIRPKKRYPEGYLFREAEA
jgi:hypothetical protein